MTCAYWFRVYVKYFFFLIFIDIVGGVIEVGHLENIVYDFQDASGFIILFKIKDKELVFLNT